MEVGNREKIGEIRKAETMAGIDLDFQAVGLLCGRSELVQGGRAFVWGSIGKSTGVQFDDWSLESSGCIDLARSGV
jgi:hypothetical protein